MVSIKSLILIALLLAATQSFAAEFIRPVDGDAIRANNGDIGILVSVTPGKQYVFKIDGSEIPLSLNPKTKVIGFTIRQMDRGEHTFEIVSEDESAKITINVLRSHI